MDRARLTPELLTSLPVDLRAVEVLRALTSEEPRSLFFNRSNVRLELEQYQWGDGHPSAARAYEEALDWLHTRGLLAREPSQSNPDYLFVTARGWELAEGESGVERIMAAERLGIDLHPLLADRIRSQYLLGEYEAAAFLAMREVEIRVRDLADASAADLGVGLMKSAFGDKGPLKDPDLEPGEQQATMALFWGAIGVFKNPSSHRQVDFADPTLASEVILFADLLLRMLDETAAEKAVRDEGKAPGKRSSADIRSSSV